MIIKCTLEESDIIKLIAEHYKIDEDDISIHTTGIDTPNGLIETVEARFTKECSADDIRKI